MREKQKKLLIELRSILVGKLHMQPFTIYTNETIKALLMAQPKTIKELEKVKGFPADGKRIKGFGDAVIAIFTKSDNIDALTLEGNEETIRIRVKMKKITAF